MNIFSLTLHFTVRNNSGLCSLLHITCSHSFFNCNLIYISHMSVLLLFISLYLCHYRSCLVLLHSFSHIVTFDMFINLWMYNITSSFYSLPNLLCSTNPLTIFLILVSLLYVKLALHMVPLCHFFTVTHVPSFCSLVHLSRFSVHASFELPTAVLPESQIFWELNTS